VGPQGREHGEKTGAGGDRDAWEDGGLHGAGARGRRAQGRRGRSNSPAGAGEYGGDPGHGARRS